MRHRRPAWPGWGGRWPASSQTRGITVNLVAPGPIETDMLAAVNADTISAMEEQVPAGRLGQADEVAAAVAYLASEDASYVTGATIPVDGGLGMGA